MRRDMLREVLTSVDIEKSVNSRWILPLHVTSYGTQSSRAIELKAPKPKKWRLKTFSKRHAAFLKWHPLVGDVCVMDVKRDMGLHATCQSRTFLTFGNTRRVP